MRNPEPRFYPSYYLRIDNYEVWRAMERGKRAAIGWDFVNDIRRLLIERVQEIHPDWNERQQLLMHFKLSYKGDCFEEMAGAQIKRGHLTEMEVEAVRAVPIPIEREDALRYAGISHLMLDENQMTWPEN